MLKAIFIALLKNYTDNENLINELWAEIEQHYTNKKRHYHTLEHLNKLFNQLSEIKNEIQYWHILLFSLFYHDIIYNTLISDNEEKSAALAVKRLTQLGIADSEILLCKHQILATKSHQLSDNTDTNYFTDADLSILGQNWETYSNYMLQVRKEYAIYPDFIYKKGRKKVVHHFLAMENIYKTTFFRKKLEQQAKQNLQKELSIL